MLTEIRAEIQHCLRQKKKNLLPSLLSKDGDSLAGHFQAGHFLAGHFLAGHFLAGHFRGMRAGFFDAFRGHPRRQDPLRILRFWDPHFQIFGAARHDFIKRKTLRWAKPAVRGTPK